MRLTRYELRQALETWQDIHVSRMPESQKHSLIGDKSFRESMAPLVGERIELLRRQRSTLNTAQAKNLREAPCIYCEGPGGTVDHVIPVLYGGTDDEDNLVPACRSCNSSKGTKSFDAFLAT